MEYSLIEFFGVLPVKPKLFAALPPKLKWLGKAVEGESWCVTCGTLDPQTPRAHHTECYSFLDADEFPEYKNPLVRCPECDSDYLSIDSSRELQYSVISCGDCGYQYADEVPEETLTEQFLASRKIT